MVYKKRKRSGWVEMWHPTLPDNDPIDVHESAVASKRKNGWLEVGEMPSEGAPTAENWGLEDDDESELTEDGD